MSTLWRGTWATRARVASGLVLFLYAFAHFLNIGMGLFSPYLLEVGQDIRQAVTRTTLGGILLYGAFLVHGGLALGKLAGRRTLRMPAWEAVQIVLGIVIPLMLAVHVIHTRLAHEIFGVNDEMGYIIALIWGSPDAIKQSILLLIVWIHGCLGLHFWLRGERWWRRSLPWLISLATLVPAMALAGFMTEGRRLRTVFSEDEQRTMLMNEYNWPDWETFGQMAQVTSITSYTIWSLLALCALIFLGRRLLAHRQSIRVRYVDGPQISAQRGMTLLEMSRSAGVPHTALCGGRGRCTTCRVIIEDGAEDMPPPSDAEVRSLRAVGAPSEARLACQVRPQKPVTVFRVFRPDGRRAREHASTGEERQLAIMFLDMRGFTSRTTGQLPYDVVFLLNRFFDAVVPAITSAGGSVDKYMGDGLLAVFDAPDAADSARAALKAAAGVRRALEAFNHTLSAEGTSSVSIGVAIHLGDLVLGEIGAAGQSSRTIIGDTVNVASRLETEAKAMGAQFLISGPVLYAAGVEADTKAMKALSLRGVTEPVAALPVTADATLPAPAS